MQPVIDADIDHEVLAGGLASLSNALWYQRALLQVLAHRAKVAELVMAGDDRRWIDRAVVELEDALRDVRAHDHVPARLLAAIGRHLHLRAPVTLRDLVGVVPEPFSSTIAEHVASLGRVLDELRATDRENRQLAMSGLGNVREMLHLLSGDAARTDAGYTRSGRAVEQDLVRLDRLM